MSANSSKVALITGSAKRVGACLARYLHAQGFRVVIHYHQSEAAAQQLCGALNKVRPQSALALPMDLTKTDQVSKLIDYTIKNWQRLDVLINNAASFNAVPLAQLSLSAWQNTLDSNLSAPFFLALAASPHLRKTQGCIINLADIRASQPLKNYEAYCISKAGLVMMTKALAKAWAPDIRVNAIAPGVALWPDESESQALALREKIIARTPLKRAGTPEDIAQAAWFLIQNAPYMTGQLIAVDGGRSLAY